PALRLAPRRCANLGERRPGRMGGRGRARRRAPLPAGARAPPEAGVAARSVRAPRGRAVAVPHAPGAHLEGAAAQGEARARGEKTQQGAPLGRRYFFSSSTLPIFSTAP